MNKELVQAELQSQDDGDTADEESPSDRGHLRTILVDDKRTRVSTDDQKCQSAINEETWQPNRAVTNENRRTVHERIPDRPVGKNDAEPQPALKVRTNTHHGASVDCAITTMFPPQGWAQDTSQASHCPFR